MLCAMRWLFLWASLVALGAAAAPAAASVTLALDLRELVERSDRVVVGSVLRQEARWDARRRIVTDVTVEVEQTMKGEPAREIVVRRLGGAIGELGMRVEGEPDFTDGQRAVLFARRLGSGALRPVGMGQGVLPIDVRPDGIERVLPNAAGLSLVERLPGNTFAPAPPAILHPRPLSDVLAEIRRIVEETSAR